MTKTPAKSQATNGAAVSLSILLYGHNKVDRNLLLGMLDQEHQMNFRITEVGDKSKVERIIQTDSPDVILLSSNVKDYPEMKFLRKMRKHDIAPVVMVASDGDEQSAVTAMKIGVYDYIPKSYLTFDHLTKSVVSANEKWRLLKETERLQAELAHMAMYDALTETLSRRALMEQLEIEMQRSKRHDRKLTLFMADIDHFKRVNDTYGHVAGDAVIREIAGTLKSNTRRSDYVGRYGGEEFLILLPETPIDKAMPLANKLREQAARLKVRSENITLDPVTISIGVADFEEDSSLEQFIDRVDQGLYQAKEGGRNKVVRGPSLKK